MAGPVNTVTGSRRALAIAAASVKASSRVKGPSGAEDSETAQNGKVSGVIGVVASTYQWYHTFLRYAKGRSVPRGKELGRIGPNIFKGVGLGDFTILKHFFQGDGVIRLIFQRCVIALVTLKQSN